MKKILKILAIILCLTLCFSLFFRLGASLKDNSNKTEESNEKITISILGDSISTCEGITDNTKYNLTLGANQSRYYAKDVSYSSTEATLALDSWKDTYWGQTICDLDLELLVNNSWRGTKVSGTLTSSSATCGTRATQLHNRKNNEPDIILIYIGTNDYNAKVDVGAYATVSDIFDGTSYIGDVSKFSYAYATMVHKVTQRYKNSQIYLCDLIYATELGNSYNSAINTIAKEFDCSVVNFSQLVETWSWTNHCMDGLHPNVDGFTLMAEILTADLKKNL